MNQNNTNKKPGFWVKFLITISALASTLGLWNLFAREMRLVTEVLSSRPVSTDPPQYTATTQPTPQPTPFTKLFLGGAAPSEQTVVVDQQPVTQTQSSR